LDDEQELTPQERAALTGWMFAQLKPGMGVTTSEVAEWTGMTVDGARQMLNKLSRLAVPLYRVGRRWFVLRRNGKNNLPSDN
jgi:hypothetical protein